MKRWQQMGIGVAIVAASSTGRVTAAWYETTKVSGDLRYRVEHVDEEGKDERYHHRIRLRLGLTAQPDDEFTVGLRLTTSEQAQGEGDPISGNMTLKNFGTKKPIFLDLAYIEWQPKELPGLVVMGGKTRNPFYTVGDYLWDHDYTPEGLAANWTLGKDWQLGASAAYHWIQERKADDDSMMYGGQLRFSGPLIPKTRWVIGGSVFSFTEMEGRPVLDWQGTGKSYGNSIRTVVSGETTNTVYATGFNTAEGFAALQFDLALPIEVYGAWAVNTDADQDDTGYIAGVSVGRLSKPGSVQVGYNYRRLEKDVFPGAFTDSDSFGGGTDAQGHRFSIAVQLTKAAQASVTYFLDEKHLDDPHDYRRLQVDLIAKF